MKITFGFWGNQSLKLKKCLILNEKKSRGAGVLFPGLTKSLNLKHQFCKMTIIYKNL